VITAGESGGVAPILVANCDPAMRAPVEECTDCPIGVSTEDDRSSPKVRELKIIGLWNLTLVAQIDPGTSKDAFHFVGKNDWLRVKRPVNTVVLEEGVIVGLVCRR
tara:strand:+ start:227 stop:544 length:318 start_codon:yes stop_codon:yes gene_type:complete